MSSWSPRTRASLAVVIAIYAIGVAGAADSHRAVTQSGGGSGGATTYLQTSSAGGALQGEVAASVNGKIAYPFGVLGEYDASNSTFGVGVLGISTSGYAVGGESLSASQPSILGYPGGTGIGVEGVEPNVSSSAPAIYAESKSKGDGVMGVLDANNSEPAGRAAIAGVDNSNDNNAYAVYAQSSQGDGLYALSSSGLGIVGVTTSGTAGVYGANDNSATPGPDGPYPSGLAGVEGTGSGGPGGYFSSTSGDAADMYTYGVLGTRTTAIGQYGTGAAVFGQDVGLTTFSVTGLGYPTEAVVATGQSFGVVITTTSTGTSYPLYVEGGGNTVAYIDGTGALYLHNGVHNFVSTRGGGSVESYTPHSSAPTIEDVGEGRLSDGRGVVQISSAMIATLDRRESYHVFLTPEADTDGLYLAQKTPGYFVVRETHGGRGSFAFEYRVVGTLDGNAGTRMAVSTRRKLSDGIAIPHMPAIATEARRDPHAIAAVDRNLKRRPFVAPPVRPPFALPRDREWKL